GGAAAAGVPRRQRPEALQEDRVALRADIGLGRLRLDEAPFGRLHRAEDRRRARFVAIDADAEVHLAGALVRPEEADQGKQRVVGLAGEGVEHGRVPCAVCLPSGLGQSRRKIDHDIAEKAQEAFAFLLAAARLMQVFAWGGTWTGSRATRWRWTRRIGASSACSSRMPGSPTTGSPRRSASRRRRCRAGWLGWRRAASSATR